MPSTKTADLSMCNTFCLAFQYALAFPNYDNLWGFGVRISLIRFSVPRPCYKRQAQSKGLLVYFAALQQQR